MTASDPTPCQHDGCDRPGHECRNFAVDESSPDLDDVEDPEYLEDYE
jgi:hypothetical protein